VSQKIEKPKADLISELSSILSGILSRPHKEPESINNPPNIPYSSGTPIGKEASKLRDEKYLPPNGTLL
jgi:hypothetical protein